MRGVLLPPVRSAAMAASVASRGRALLWAGAAWLRQRGTGELLRPRIEGSTPGRDFSLSHYQVRAGWGLRSYTVGDRSAVHARLRPRGWEADFPWDADGRRGDWVLSADTCSPSLPDHQNTVIVERWWKVPLAGEGRKPRLYRRHRVYKLVEDTKHRPKDNLELILTQSVDGKAWTHVLTASPAAPV